MDLQSEFHKVCITFSTGGPTFEVPGPYGLCYISIRLLGSLCIFYAPRVTYQPFTIDFEKIMYLISHKTRSSTKYNLYNQTLNEFTFC